MTDHRLTWQAASICLRYPHRDDLFLVRDLLPSFVDSALAVAAESQGQLERHYVEVFDFTNRHSLYLTWFTDGDTRRRGTSLVQLKRRYAEANLLLTDTELPDYLPTVLEYSARTGDVSILAEHRPGIATLHKALSKLGTVYALPLEAILATIPEGVAAPVNPPPSTEPPIELVGIG